MPTGEETQRVNKILAPDPNEKDQGRFRRMTVVAMKQILSELTAQRRRIEELEEIWTRAEQAP